MVEKKRVIQIGLWLYIFLVCIQFLIHYIKGYKLSQNGVGISNVLNVTWENILLDIPQSILVIIGCLVLFQFTKGK
ncbi:MULTISPECIES: DUF3937 family protein [Bacillus cereus group]|uniref:DUF3937 family protein n=1 Tax=Bacillus cereus group TaxID=86661 RepID=UPI0007DB0D9B|nr:MULTISPECIES: DUF3937 family protein [Bacillus cereus group]OAK08707.1 hypothetical protein A6280_25390 [Bacillus wiedmannii]PEK10408.1 hypothetical protein CN681_11375 [Bacillus toyonensis]PGA49631.1 hypothetical protein COL86_31420 [Bacillus toyonensis]PGB96438.1 hypothetical protein COM19_20850 [Bacillus toyonensis]PGU35085.1 hypothetical protein COD91_29995 [Bacillus cereus]